MNISKQTKNLSTKTCAHIGCENTFIGSPFQRFCNDQRCKDIRALEQKQKHKNAPVDKDADNRIVSKTIISRAISMKKKTIILRCKAHNINGHICNSPFQVTLEVKKSVYPKYCSKHRNAYKRQRYKLSKEK